MYTVSVDIGGTFTDVVVFDEVNGRTVVGKSLTTPGDLQKGVIDGLKQTADDLDVPLNSLLAEAHRFVHATTQSSNAIFAFAGAKTAVVTTRGIRRHADDHARNGACGWVERLRALPLPRNGQAAHVGR